ncbi:MAG: hypothetical protein WBB19_03745 [Desulforhopalus sp.]
MSLADNLQKISEGSKERIPKETRVLMQKATAELRDSGIMDRVPQVGDVIPPFRLPNWNGAMVSSKELLEQGNLVLTFYRGVW